MTIPKKVKIGGLVYDVEITKNISMGNNYTAEIIYEDLKINVRPMKEMLMQRYFLHEIVHGIYDQLGYKDHDEKQIDELAAAFHALITDNPEIFSEPQ